MSTPNYFLISATAAVLAAWAVVFGLGWVEGHPIQPGSIFDWLGALSFLLFLYGPFTAIGSFGVLWPIFARARRRGFSFGGAYVLQLLVAAPTGALMILALVGFRSPDLAYGAQVGAASALLTTLIWIGLDIVARRRLNMR